MERTTRIDAAPQARQPITWFDVGLTICSILAAVLDFFVGLGRLALEGMGRLVTWAAEQIAKVLAKLGFNMGAKALFGVLSKLVPLAVPLLIVFRRWLGEESNEWFWWYLGTLAALIVAGRIARRWGDGLSLPLRLRYSRGSGWSATYAYTAVGHYRRPWTAARALITLRRRLRKADSRYENQPLRGPLSELPVQLGQVRRCLEAWAGFPADRDPRPLVLLGRSVRVGPFPGEKAQSAFAYDLLQAAPNFPAELLDAVTRQRQQAGPGEPQVVVTAADTGRLITATRGTAEFLTDRGEQELPGWNVQVQGVLSEAGVLHPRHQPIWVLDPGVTQQAWRPAGLADHELCWRGSTAQVSQDGRTVILKFAGKPYTYYPRAEVLGDDDGCAVAIVPVARRRRRLRRRWERPEVSVELSKPLGSRVLLDGNSCPVLIQG